MSAAGLGTGHWRERIAAAYESSADAYARSASAIYGPLGRALAAAVAAAPGERIVDLGSGAGAVARALDGADVVAVDISPGQLRNSPLVHRVGADTMALPFKDTAFDAATGGFWIGHFRDPVGALTEARRVLRRGGRIALSTWARPEAPYRPKTAVLAALERVAGSARTRTAEAVEAITNGIGTRSRLGRALHDAGFRAVGVERRLVTIPWPGAEAFVDYRLAMLDAASLLGSSDQALFRAEAICALEAIPEEELTWQVAILIGTARR